jgi:hypothetical protein
LKAFRRADNATKLEQPEPKRGQSNPTLADWQGWDWKLMKSCAKGREPMRVYQEMMFGLSHNEPRVRDKYRKLSFQYCELDSTASMRAEHAVRAD